MTDELVVRKKKIAEKNYNEMKSRATKFWELWAQGAYSKPRIGGVLEELYNG